MGESSASGAALLGLAALGLVGAPLIGAVILRATSTGPRTRAAIVGLAVLAMTGGLLAAAWQLRSAATPSVDLSLGWLDPDGVATEVAWTLAPTAFSVLFAVIALRARSLTLSALAALQLAIVLPSTLRDLGEANTARPAAATMLLDPLSLALLSVSVLVGALIIVFSLGYQPIHLRHAGQDVRRTGPFIAWLFLFLAAMHLLVLADDLRLLAVGWEATTLCSYVLIGYDRDAQAGAAARRALAYNLLGGAALASGIWLAGPHASLSGLLASPAASGLPLIVALFAVAAATKSALAPFHPWLLGAMVAAAPVSALLHASTMVKAGSYVLLRLSPALAESGVGLAVAILGAFSFAGAAMLALRERDLKRVLALSTVASLGAIAAAAGLGSPAALAAGIVFLVLHAVAKALAFLVVGATEQVTGTRDLEALVGLGRARPWLAAPLLLAAAAMALPPFGIAVAKWVMLLASGDEIPVVLLLAVGAAANVALWTSVASRLLVRRSLPVNSGAPVRRSELLAIAGLAFGVAAGLVAAGPLAAGLGDPAAILAFGRAAPLADGLAVAVDRGMFPVLPIAAALVLAAGASLVVVRGLRTRPEPYLGGGNVGPATEGRFHAARGGTRAAASGGFYWGAALGAGGDPLTLRNLVAAAGWAMIAGVALAGLLRVAGVTT